MPAELQALLSKAKHVLTDAEPGSTEQPAA